MRFQIGDVVVEAVQYRDPQDPVNREEVISFLARRNGDMVRFTIGERVENELFIMTKQFPIAGSLRARPSDWIVLEPEGAFDVYPSRMFTRQFQLLPTPKTPEVLLAELRERIREIALKVSPDYPGIQEGLTDYEHLWAIEATEEGANRALEDWQVVVEELMARYQISTEQIVQLSRELRQSGRKPSSGLRPATPDNLSSGPTGPPGVSVPSGGISGDDGSRVPVGEELLARGTRIVRQLQAWIQDRDGLSGIPVAHLQWAAGARPGSLAIHIGDICLWTSERDGDDEFTFEYCRDEFLAEIESYRPFLDEPTRPKDTDAPSPGL